jgi:hypothetical protein
MILLDLESVFEVYAILEGPVKCPVVVVASRYGKSDLPDRGIALSLASQQLFS